MSFLKLYLATIPVFFAIDMVWLGLVAKDFYRQQLGQLLRQDVRWGAAVLFYLIFIAGLLVFVVLPAVERDSLGRAVLLGGFFGLVTYATFDLVSLALLKDFPLTVVVVDMIWGVVLSAAVSAAAFKLAGWLL